MRLAIMALLTANNVDESMTNAETALVVLRTSLREGDHRLPSYDLAIDAVACVSSSFPLEVRIITNVSGVSSRAIMLASPRESQRRGDQYIEITADSATLDTTMSPSRNVVITESLPHPPISM